MSISFMVKLEGAPLTTVMAFFPVFLSTWIPATPVFCLFEIIMFDVSILCFLSCVMHFWDSSIVSPPQNWSKNKFLINVFVGILSLVAICNSIFPIFTRLLELKSVNNFLDFFKFLVDLDLNPMCVF